ncbi:MAG TPA: cupin domain-containing protein [Firmicutes bacterium]|nr:cupin domain-containing protein [Bacillota bacterium]
MEIKWLEENVRFDPEKPVRQLLFSTPKGNTVLVCLEPGQSLPLHQHIGSEEVITVLEGEGEIVIGDEVMPFDKPFVALVPADTSHLTRSTRKQVILVGAIVPRPEK